MTILISFFCALSVWGTSYSRLDKLAQEEVSVPSKGIIMFMTQGCIHCKGQLQDFEKCLDKSIPVLLFLEGKNEEILRKEVRRRGYKYPVYWTRDELKKNYGVGLASPTTILLYPDGKKKIEGRLKCDELKPLLNRFF